MPVRSVGVLETLEDIVPLLLDRFGPALVVPQKELSTPPPVRPAHLVGKMLPRTAVHRKRSEVHGTTVWQRSAETRRERNAPAQARYLREWPQRQEGEKPQAGHRHRFVGSTQERREGPAQEGRIP